MKTSIIGLLDDAQKKMSGYAALYNYRLHNLCVKANAEALLSISVDLDGVKLPIEKVARARNPKDRDDQFEIYPDDREVLFPLVKGIKESHPEFDLDIRDVDVDENEAEEDKMKYILATMPVVDDNRHDALTEGVKTLSGLCDGKMEGTFARCVADIAVRLADAPPDELDEAKDALQELYDKHKELVKQFTDDKEQEIEDAYAAWQAAQAEKEAKQQEEEAAHNAMAGLQMKMNPDEEDE